MKAWFDAVLAFFYPAVCQICHSKHASPDSGYVCDCCWLEVRFINPPYCDRCGLPYDGAITNQFECGNCKEMDLRFESARAAVAATGIVLEIIHRYKYHRALWFEPFLAEFLVRQAAPVLRSENWDLIVPVPLHALKKREREFNQAERLAKHLSDATGIPLNTGLLKRVEATRTQTLLSRRERAENVGKAFAWAQRKRLDGERIVLLDDVLTTGATTSACAKVLRQNGSGAVSVWTVARGL